MLENYLILPLPKKIKIDDSRKEYGWSPKYYSGIWEEGGNEGNELFDDVFKLIDKTKFNIEGTNNIFSEARIINKDGKKMSSSDSTVNSTKLKKWFKPFENKKGKWSDLIGDCIRESEIRNLTEETKKWLENHCYVKK